MPTNEFEFDAMQEEAIRQAREMFSRASSSPEPYFDFNTKEDPFGLSSGGTETVKTENRKKNVIPIDNKPMNLFGGIFRDKDIVLLLALVLLLSSDGGDRLLILALIYIMS